MTDNPHGVLARFEGLSARIDSLERDMNRVESLLRSSVDDIKATVKAEVSDLKTEQISDLKKQLELCNARIDGQNLSISDLRTKQQEWDTGAKVVNWMIRFVVAALGLVAGYFGAKHLG